MTPEAVAYHRFAMDRLSRVVMTDTDKILADKA
jgi:hypothetical protein